MKNIKYIKFLLLGTFLLCTLNSCTEFLQDASVPLDQPGGDDFYNTPLKVKGGIVGIYDQLYTLYSQPPSNDALFNVYENRSDNGWRLPDPNNNDHHDNFNTQVQDAPGKMWNNNYVLISRANNMIDAIRSGFPDYENDEEMARLMGEARFLRAFGYFHLVTIFGDVPLITEQIRTVGGAQDVTRSPVNEVFKQIIADLEFAAENNYTRSTLEIIGDLGHAPKAAAKVLLAEAYLFQGRYEDAERIAEEVINSGEYLLVTPYSALYGEGADNHAESILEIQYDFNLTGQATQYSRLLPFALREEADFTFTTTVSVPSDDLLYAMVGDNRYSVTLDSGLVDPDDPDRFERANFWKKYMDFSISENVDDDWNIQLFRLADAYHLAAEAEIQQGKIEEALDHLNVLRERAEMPEYDPTGVSQDEALDMYLHERRMEFAGEMKRWRDLKRTGKVIEVMEAYLGSNIDENQLVYPIPISEIQANPEGITQNPGY